MDASEVRKFAGLQWWSGNSSDDAANALRQMHGTRLQAIKETLSSSSRLRDLTLNKPGGFTALDVGCGGGLMTMSLKRDLGAGKVLGIDPNPSGIEAARAQAVKEGLDINFELCTTQDLVKRGEKFDVVCSLEVIEHVSDKNAFLEQCVELCNGVLILSSMKRNLTSWALAIAAAEHVAGIVPKGTHDWRKFVNISEIEEVVVHQRRPNSNKRFHTEAIIRLDYNPLSKKWSYAKTAGSGSPIPVCNYIYIAAV